MHAGIPAVAATCGIRRQLSGSEGTRLSVGAFSSLVASGGVQAVSGKGRRTGEAPHEVFGTTVIVSFGLVGDGYGEGRRVLACRYGLTRKSVGLVRDGQGCETSITPRARVDTSASCWLRTLRAMLRSQRAGATVPQLRSATGVPFDGIFRADHNAA